MTDRAREIFQTGFDAGRYFEQHPTVAPDDVEAWADYRKALSTPAMSDADAEWLRAMSRDDETLPLSACQRLKRIADLLDTSRAVDERTAAVTWLRRVAQARDDRADPEWAKALFEAADFIERGEHLIYGRAAQGERE